MKHDLFFLIFMSTLAFLFAVVGALALLGYWNAEVIFWTQIPIQSEMGKVIWIIVSASCFVIFTTFAVVKYRRK
jgi:hypothetical protein